MRRLLRMLLLTAVLLIALCVSAAAAQPTTAGMYNIQSASDVTVSPAGSDPSEVTIGDGTIKDYYGGAVKFDISATGYNAGEQCLALVIAGEKGSAAVTESSIYYIDQAASDGAVNFTIFPKDMGKGHYCVYLVSASHPYDAEKPTAEFDYYVPYVLGDVDNDTYWTANDALYTLQIAVNKTTLVMDGENKAVTSTMRLAADTDKDDYITANDALLILQKAVGKNVF